MKHTKQKWVASLLAFCLLLSLMAPAAAADMAAENTEVIPPVAETLVEAEVPDADAPEVFAAAAEVTVPRRADSDVATIHYTDSSGEEQNIPFQETADGYVYTLPAGVSGDKVTVEYFSTVRWDGAVDISWYDADSDEFTLTAPAQLAGLAALVNGRVSAETSRWRIKGDTSLMVSTKLEDQKMTGGAGGDQTATIYRASADYDFSDKVVYLGCDMDMGGANWTPIGGKYAMDPESMEDPIPIEAFFNGTLDGRGHRITNLTCDRYAKKGYVYSQAIGLVGYLGETYSGESAPEQAPTVRNLSVSGSVYGRRMVGGIVGRVGSISTGVRIENCANYAAISSTDSKGIGGIVGAGWGKGYIINCYNAGTVSTTYASPAGGICGNNQGLNIYACYNVGTINSNGNKRGRGIGGHDSGTYTVANCYTLSGCDDDPDSKGWYVGTGTSCTIDIGVWEQPQMQSQALTDALNANGGAYVYVSGGYPKLFWENGWPSGTSQVTVQSTSGVTVTAAPGGSVARGTVVYLSHTVAAGSVFRYYTANGKELLGDYYLVTDDVTISAVAEGMTPGTLHLPESSIYTLTVKKTGTALVDGTATNVKDYTVVNGDPIYEGDVLTVKAFVKDGVYPDDNDYIYGGRFDYIFTYQDGESDPVKKLNVLQTTFTVTGTDAPLEITAEARTTRKTWLQVADTSWYSSSGTEFTLTTARQLAGLAQLVNNGTDNFSGKTIRLGCDISLRNDDGTHGTRLWDGIGASNSFNGTFDGGGHSIFQMTAGMSATSGRAALFITCSGAVIKDLAVSGTAMASRAAGMVLDMENTTIRNGTVSVTVTAGGYGFSGGIAGKMTGGTMENCVNRYAVTGVDGVGGLTGSLEGGAIQDCANYGAVSGNGSSNGLGGLIGKTIKGTLLRCANYGPVSGINLYVGGLIGLCDNSAQNGCQITDCYNASTVTGGYTGSNADIGVGGLVGKVSVYTMTNCFNSGAVTIGDGLSGAAGGVFGYDSVSYKSSGENLWYLDSTCANAVGATATGSAGTAKITGCTAEQLADGTVLKALNRNGCFAQGEDYPELSDVPCAYVIRGQVSAAGRTVTVSLMQGGKAVRTLTTAQDFSFSLRTTGSYSLLFSAEGCVARNVMLPQDSNGAVGVVRVTVLGDINMDGAVDVYDLQRLYEHLNGINRLSDEYALQLANVDSSGGVTVQDLQRLYEQLTGQV